VKFRVRVTNTELTTLNGQPAVKFKAVSIDTPGEVIVTVPIVDAVDYKVGDIVRAEVRTSRAEDT